MCRKISILLAAFLALWSFQEAWAQFIVDWPQGDGLVQASNDFLLEGNVQRSAIGAGIDLNNRLTDTTNTEIDNGVRPVAPPAQMNSADCTILVEGPIAMAAAGVAGCLLNVDATNIAVADTELIDGSVTEQENGNSVQSSLDAILFQAEQVNEKLNVEALNRSRRNDSLLNNLVMLASAGG